MFAGREQELAGVAGLLASARASRGGGVVLVGEPGIGKSALLRQAARLATDMRVLQATGAETEAPLAYAVLHQLLYPVLNRVDLLPAPQADALGVALGSRSGAAPDRFLVSAGTLTLLSDLADERPVACLVDDLQWADGPSRDVLAFVARRLGAEPVALIAAARTAADGPRVLSLAPLGADESAAVLDASFPGLISPEVRDRLVEAAGGNPLALEEIPRGLTWRELAGLDPLLDPLPLSTALEGLFSTRVRRLDPDVRVLVVLCAADGSGHLPTLARAAERLDVSLDPLDSGVLDDLVRIDRSGAVAFRHPLVRSAAYHGAPHSTRQAVHAALARAGTEPTRRVWHLARAVPGPDEEVARELELVAERTLRRSGDRTAVTVLHQAARLSPDASDRARRLIAAAEAAWRSGDAPRTRTLLDEARPLAEAGDPRIDHLHGLTELRDGDAAEAVRILVSAASRAVDGAVHRPVQVLLDAGEAAFHTADAAAAKEVDRLLGRLPHAGTPLEQALVRLMLGIAPLARGEHPDGLDDDLAVIEGSGDPHLLVRAGGVALTRGDLGASRRLRAAGVAGARRLGAAGTLAWALWFQANDEILNGRYAAAEAIADEGHRLSLETGQSNIAWQHQATMATLCGLRGRADEAVAKAREVIAFADARGLATAGLSARHALTLLALSEGRGEDALEQLEVMRDLMSSGHHAVSITVIPNYVEAATRVDLRDRGAEAFARHLTWAEEAPATTEVRALAARCRALLSDGDEADRWFRTALDHHHASGMPLDHARTALLYGEFLRRRKRRTDARGPLRLALATFERLGATIWARRARSELRATGVTTGVPDPSGIDLLTPQEIQVARVVGEGLTSRQAAAQLFLSPRTVDYHLRKIYQKLGIASRAELARLDLSDRD
ncbi:LuxR family transcriptional regulator [Actinomadura spongiicola]|uniref:LuxR family transcriptional regulator n=1 Tax=Actinomadura spongiicola TaxID=2303421 RepID=A0A372GPV9_9ACTN|nr:LuxR family transcriptional regulator [Actinomadura spongiicola]RFS87416.1 LuxR family transcriptional regulator [Actinomadura spongiicola]